MKRFLKIATLLIVSLFLLVSGVDATLDQMSHFTKTSSFTWYDEKGNITVAYFGDLSQCKSFTKLGPTPAPFMRHSNSRTSLQSEESPRLF